MLTGNATSCEVKAKRESRMAILDKKYFEVLRDGNLETLDFSRKKGTKYVDYCYVYSFNCLCCHQ